MDRGVVLSVKRQESTGVILDCGENCSSLRNKLVKLESKCGSTRALCDLAPNQEDLTEPLLASFRSYQSRPCQFVRKRVESLWHFTAENAFRILLNSYGGFDPSGQGAAQQIGTAGGKGRFESVANFVC